MDISDSAKVHLSGGLVAGNQGALLAWGAAKATLEQTHLQGGVWTTLLADCDASIKAMVIHSH